MNFKRLISTLIYAVSSLVIAETGYLEVDALALRGTPKYPSGFEHFDYVNPNAPKGGLIRKYAVGTFDSLNAFGQRGNKVIGGLALYGKLMTNSADEVSVYYPMIAERVRYAADYSSITFFINNKAQFSDGKPIKATDVQFSFEKFKAQGVPQFAKFYEFVTQVTVDSDYQVTFHMQGADREKMLALCTLSILPEHYWHDKDLAEPLKEVPVGSSGVTISDFKFGQYVVYKTLENYWAKDLPVNKGQGNFDEYRYDYYRDQNVAFEAFKAGEIDFWQENTAKQWHTGYDFPAVQEGRIIKAEIPRRSPKNTEGFIFNTQHELFSDIRVREALSYALDFEWMNENLFYQQYQRTVSFFQDTEYMARALPSQQELEILEPIRHLVQPNVFTQVYEPPMTDGSGNIRSQLRKSLQLLKQAGWEVKNQQLTHMETGKVFRFELLTYQPMTERIAIPLKNNLARLGIEMTIRQVDSSQFFARLRKHDFEMISSSYNANVYPASNMQIVWHSDFIDSSFNLANVNDEAVDYLIEGIVQHQNDAEALLHWGRALDRVLLWNHYIIPKWHGNSYRVAYLSKFKRPETAPVYQLGASSWWQEQDSQPAE